LKRISLGLAVHNHQPVGNFPWVFEDAYSRAYLPMLQALKKHPAVKMSLHYSGPLVDWLRDNHPDFFDLLRELALKGQVELMGGGYYEPILPAIPDVDRYGQIEKMSRFIAEKFRARPRGMWLAERVWEPELAGVLPAAGIEWTLVDDTAFRLVGKSEAELFGYYLTEDQGRYLKVYPISKYLRYAVPWHDVERVIEYFKENATEEGERIAVLGDDGEKFGVWPETYELCWERGWVEDFFIAIEENAEWLKTVRLGDYLKQQPPAGRVYLPCAAYDEMMEWSLPAGRSREYVELKHRLEDEGRLDELGFMGSGFWRNFMVKYPEANRMHKRMLLVSDKVHRANRTDSTTQGLDDLWKAQCNCPYWHGVFGGIYLSDIRAEAYANLIRAENYADKVLWTMDRGYQSYRLDYDGDGQREVIVEGRRFNLYLSPAEGGSIIEWDLRGREFNLISTVSRKHEAYHADLCKVEEGHAEDSGHIKSIHDVVRVKDLGLAPGDLVYDSLPRSGLIDCFVETGMTLERWERNDVELPNEFAGRPYECTVDSTEKALAVRLKRAGHVKSGDDRVELLLEKTIRMPNKEERLEVGFRFTNKGGKPLSTVFASEWNINLLGGGHNDSACYVVEGRELEDDHLDSRGELKDIKGLALANKNLRIELALELDRPLTVWRLPVECVSNSEGGIEMVYQASCLVVLLPLELEPGKKAEFSYTWSLR